MAEQDFRRQEYISGALIDWERRGADHGVILTLHIAESGMRGGHHRVSTALNDRQLRALTRDLMRAARARGLSIESRTPLRTRIWRRLKSIVN
ncbi:hypothetical protein M2337_000851 [Sphingobium sp. B2D3A]|uniref:hypothetical protein n=1 Tax=Sphingobium TaxID=165695 RepID=UPI0015EB98CF|nr:MULTISPECIES: hypothetical protein [Sphingobium]MCW2336618.1 hypothetical protein [Sphingobium sp. B2D3A]MCW2363236.1 hypothetical protein [Sphingobium sp. B10D3B]MCW2368187.1 hypothetical protein [Sphingobium sp. B11D3D]MCW2386372.1 hypothetical protein [Sphingobium sp. B2D3D]MCW2392133.1 hypothetical protein [Sphingobium sp. B11D3A]